MSDATKSEFVSNIKTLVWVGGVVIACLFGIKNIVKEANEDLYEKINLNQQLKDNIQDNRIDDNRRRIDIIESVINNKPASSR